MENLRNDWKETDKRVQIKVDCRDQSNVTDAATPSSQVSAFVRAVITNVWPRDLFGAGDEGANNWRLLMTQIDAFIVARRYETMSLDTVMAGLKVRQKKSCFVRAKMLNRSVGELHRLATPCWKLRKREDCS